MPSNFTYKLYEGEPQTFAEFALHTARAFGPGARMRDEPDGPISVEGVQSGLSYDKERILESGKRIGELLTMSDEQLEEAVTKQYQSELKGHLRSNQLERRRRAAYSGMMEQLEEWTPPTPGHEPLKDYMRDQLEQTFRNDGANELDPFKGHPVKKKPEEYRKAQIDRAQGDFDDSLHNFAKSSVVNSKNAEWVEQLQASLQLSQD